jgi:hypothetical protein
VCMLFPVIVRWFLMNDDVLEIHDCILTPAFFQQIKSKGAFESAIYSVMQDMFPVQRRSITWYSSAEISSNPCDTSRMIVSASQISNYFSQIRRKSSP